MRVLDIITTSQKQAKALEGKARRVACVTGIPFHSRAARSVEELKSATGAARVLVFEKNGPALYTGEGKGHRFHLSMAHLRMLALSRGQGDYLVEAVGSEHLTSFLDCTAGLGGDSAVVSFAHPDCERAVALEAVAPLAYITNDGFRHFVHESECVTAALRKIQVAAVRYESFLRRCANDAFDVVYFDPMFSTPVSVSPQFLSLRGFLEETPLEDAQLDEALRVAKRRVVVKDRPFSALFRRRPPDIFVGGTYSRVTYGVYFSRGYEPD